MPDAPPRVSVLMLTHNHAAFLRQAIASVQAQTLQTWELLIGEDGSSDDTGRIAREAALADARIRVFDSPGGALGFHHNFARLLAAARAPYVAFLEGDDWWSEPRKLALQLALLDQDRSLAFCGGRTRVIDQRASRSPAAPESCMGPASIGPAPGCRRLCLADLIEAYSFHFSSVLMRRQVVALPDWIYGQYCLDRPLYLLAARHGDAGVIEAELSVYRLHGGGAWAPLTPLQKARRSDALFQAFYRHFPRSHRRRFHRVLSHIHWSYLAAALQERQRREALRILSMAVVAAPVLRLLQNPRLTASALMRSLTVH